LNEQLYDPNRQIIRPLYYSFSKLHSSGQPLPKSKGNVKKQEAIQIG